MEWKDLKNFILERDQHFFRNQQGVSESRIAEIENRFNIKFPEGYRDFLLDAGQENTWDPFGTGSGSTSAFERLVANSSAKHYPTSSMFRIAMHNHKHSDSALDIFISLANTAAYDAAVLQYDPYGSFDPERVYEHPLSLMEILTRQIVRQFISFPHFFIIRQPLPHVVALLKNMGWVDALPPQLHVMLLRKLERFIFLEDSEPEPEFKAVIVEVSTNVVATTL